MPRADILRSSPVSKSFRVEQLLGMFDVPRTETIDVKWSVELPIEEKLWKVGLIVGPSGSGKTTIATEMFSDSHIHTGFDWDASKALVDNFDSTQSIKDITRVLSSVGLSSPPHWIKPFQHLSNGQQFRAELARVIMSDHKRVVFDEFTSVVDRDVAKVCSSALAKTIRKKKEPQLVAVSCHFDIIDWLDPDWVYDVGADRFEWRSLRRRPEIQLEVYRTDVQAWRMFRGHHYLTHDILKAAQCFVATWNGKPVAFASYVHSPHPKSKNIKREHRTVVLPDFQGVGIGNTLSEFLGDWLLKSGWRFTSTTSHPNMIRHRNNSHKWIMRRKASHAVPDARTSQKNLHQSAGRLTCAFEYVG